jgi:DNA-binding transcriptional MerR regulator
MSTASTASVASTASTAEAETEQELSIGDVAARTGLSVHALRYYEREGLLLSPHVTRGRGGHRRYTPEDVRWVDICLRLRASGMPLAEIRRYAELVREGPGNERERLGLLRAQQQRVEEQLAELSDCLRIISHKVAVYEQGVAAGTAQNLWDVTAPRG